MTGSSQVQDEPDAVGRCPGLRPDGFNTEACWNDHEHTPAASCTCTNTCGEPGDSAGCCYCNHIDAYDPCPVLGFGCGAEGGPPCTCCTPEQFAAARQAEEARRG